MAGKSSWYAVAVLMYKDWVQKNPIKFLDLPLAYYLSLPISEILYSINKQTEPNDRLL
jgi:hypothetical protein